MYPTTVSAMSLVNENNLSYVTKYESRYIQEFFQEFETCFGTPVHALNLALEEIKLDFSCFSHFTPNKELAKLDAPDVPESRRLNNIEKIQRALSARLQAARFVNEGRLDHAYYILESSASIVATLAYNLCCERDAEHTEAFAKLTL